MTQRNTNRNNKPEDKKMDDTINRLKRLDDARQVRSDAINRRLFSDADQIAELKAHLKCAYLTIAILVAIIATVGFNLK